MTRYHPYPRRALRTSFRRWTSEHRVRLGSVTLGAGALIAFETWMFSVSGGSAAIRFYLMGAVHVGIVAVYLGAITTTFLVHERHAIMQLRGAWGEDFTQDELKRARRKGLIWGWVDSVAVQAGDIDHLVVTKSGGLVAIDSKWRSDSENLDTAAIAREASKARLRAEGVLQTVLKAERGSHRARGKGFRVRPLVVVWGRAGRAVPEGANVSGVDIIEGRRLKDWLTRLEGDSIDETAAADLLAEVERFRAQRWATAAVR